MNIVKSDANTKLEQIQNNRDFISSVLDEIFIICREDENFLKVRKGVESIDFELSTIQEKLEKQNSLINRSESLKKDIVTKLSIIENENEEMKIELLRRLGSAIWE